MNGGEPIISKAKEQWLYWRLFAVKLTLFSIVQLGIAYRASTEHVDMSKLTGWEMIGVGFGMLVIWGTTVLALVDQTMSRLAAGKLPNGSGDSAPPFKIGT